MQIAESLWYHEGDRNREILVDVFLSARQKPHRVRSVFFVNRIISNGDVTRYHSLTK